MCKGKAMVNRNLGQKTLHEQASTRPQLLLHRTPASDTPAPHLHGHDLTTQEHAHAFIKASLAILSPRPLYSHTHKHSASFLRFAHEESNNAQMHVRNGDNATLHTCG